MAQLIGEGSMGRILANVLFGLFLTVMASRTHAQVEPEQQQKSEEFVQLYERWKQTQDPEEKVALGERALAVEPGLKDWPLQAPRDRVMGELWFNLAIVYR